MPQSFIKNEDKWEKAKEIVKKEYGKTEADGDEFYSLVMGVYKQARGVIHKDGKGNYYHHRKNGSDAKRKLAEGKEDAPIARKSLILENVPLLDLDELLFLQQEARADLNKSFGYNMEDKYPGGTWRTVHGHHVYIKKNGEPAAETPVGGKSNGKAETASTGTGAGKGADTRSAEEAGAGSNRGNGESGVQSGSGGGAGKEPLVKTRPLAEQLTGQKTTPEGDLPQHTVQSIKDAKVFHTAIAAAKEGNPHGAFVALYDEDEYEHKKLFMLGDGAAGIAVTDDGDIVSVFKHPTKADQQGIKNASDKLLMTALQNGGKKLDCFDGFLPRLYAKYGFEPVCRVKFDRDYAPDGWNYDRDGEPDVVFFKHNGDDAATIRSKQAAGEYKPFDMSKVPVVTDYMAGLEMRDKAVGDDVEKSLTMEDFDLTKGIGAEMSSKYPGGSWRTMRGRHVYIKKGGEMASETAPQRSSGSSTTPAAPATPTGNDSTNNVSKFPVKGKQYSFKGEDITVTDVSPKYVTYQKANGTKRSTTVQTFASKATLADNGGGSSANASAEPKASPEAAQKVSGAEAGAQAPNTAGADKGEVQAGTIPGSADSQTPATNGSAATTPPTLSAIGGRVIDGIPKVDDMQKLYSDWSDEAKKLPADNNGSRPRIYFQREFAGMFAGDNEELSQRYNGSQMYRRIDMGGKTAALIMLQDSPQQQAVQVGYVEVAPSMRKGKGIGSSAILNAIEESQNRGYNGKIFLKAHTDAIPFYEKLGMNRIDTAGGVFFDWQPEEAQDFYQKATGKALGQIAKALNTDNKTPHTAFFKQLIEHEDSLYPRGLLISKLSTRVGTEMHGDYDSNQQDDNSKPLYKYKAAGRGDTQDE